MDVFRVSKNRKVCFSDFYSATPSPRLVLPLKKSFYFQIFDKEGRFKFQFGECGKRDGQLLYPNRVAVVRNSGDIIVTERSPTHQV